MLKSINKSCKLKILSNLQAKQNKPIHTIRSQQPHNEKVHSNHIFWKGLFCDLFLWKILLRNVHTQKKEKVCLFKHRCSEKALCSVCLFIPKLWRKCVKKRKQKIDFMSFNPFSIVKSCLITFSKSKLCLQIWDFKSAHVCPYICV